MYRTEGQNKHYAEHEELWRVLDMFRERLGISEESMDDWSWSASQFTGMEGENALEMGENTP